MDLGRLAQARVDLLQIVAHRVEAVLPDLEVELALEAVDEVQDIEQGRVLRPLDQAGDVLLQELRGAQLPQAPLQDLPVHLLDRHPPEQHDRSHAQARDVVDHLPIISGHLAAVRSSERLPSPPMPAQVIRTFIVFTSSMSRLSSAKIGPQKAFALSSSPASLSPTP